MDPYEILIDGEKIRISISRHAQDRMEERNVDKYAVYGMILKMGSRLLDDLKLGEEFMAIDTDDKEALVAVVNQDENNEITVDVITVLNSYNIWVQHKTKVFKLSEIIDGL